jgi:uncharacterized protein YyaL (SSP411 family)
MLRRFTFAVRLSCLVSLSSAAVPLVRADSHSAHSAGVTPNRLASEKSPYLRQHALNPVDWFPWGEEAFKKARTENKPIFLSIGYSTCHWCHVMAQESFSDPGIAKLLNENFVCIKVDREERPDIDRVYMTFVQASTGGGGWPMSVWLTPDLKPFLGGTYFPPESRDGQPGFKSVITRVASLWKDQREKVLQQSDDMWRALVAGAQEAPSAGGLAVAELREQGFRAIADSFDEVHGGFEQAPKFPLPVMLEFLLDVQGTAADPAQRDRAQKMVMKTLREIIAGGIHDQLGGGFHRYAVDEQWRVPHFEKMLYDQAQLTNACLSAWQVSGDPVLSAAAEDTLRYVQAQLTDPAGGFRTAEDADSATAADPAVHREGAFYVWNAAEIETVLGAKNAAVFDFVYGVRAGGNALKDPAGEFRAQNILFREHSAVEAGQEFKKPTDEIVAIVSTATQQLYHVRERRPRPLRDDKIVTAWNGLMISAYARAAQILGQPEQAVTADRAARFIRNQLFDAGTGRLSHSYLGGVRDSRGFAEDYAFLIQGLIDLYEATFDPGWLDWAIRLQEKQIELFWDPVAGGFFVNASDDASVMLRLKQDDDGAEPSSNSISVRNLSRLSEMLHREEWHQLAMRTANAFSASLKRSPSGMAQMLASIGWLQGSPKLVLIHGDANSAPTKLLVDETRKLFLPRRVTLQINAGSREFFESKVPFVAALPVGASGIATAYVCENFVCQLPTTDPAVLARLLASPAKGQSTDAVRKKP